MKHEYRFTALPLVIYTRPSFDKDNEEELMTAFKKIFSQGFCQKFSANAKGALEQKIYKTYCEMAGLSFDDKDGEISLSALDALFHAVCSRLYGYLLEVDFGVRLALFLLKGGIKLDFSSNGDLGQKLFLLMSNLSDVEVDVYHYVLYQLFLGCQKPTEGAVFSYSSSVFDNILSLTEGFPDWFPEALGQITFTVNGYRNYDVICDVAFYTLFYDKSIYLTYEGGRLSLIDKAGLSRFMSFSAFGGTVLDLSALIRSLFGGYLDLPNIAKVKDMIEKKCKKIVDTEAFCVWLRDYIETCDFDTFSIDFCGKKKGMSNFDFIDSNTHFGVVGKERYNAKKGSTVASFSRKIDRKK